VSVTSSPWQLGVYRGGVVTDVDIEHDVERMVVAVTVEIGGQLHVGVVDFK
jgi:hypothetical protein